ncbi:hypothetical protein [Streptomyces termitum]|uniref:hypothetical protein n=1 Tax=Streptomyces termitum TaxID=67368 RepID=UPI00378C8F62
MATTRTGRPSFGRSLTVATGMLMLELTLVVAVAALYGATGEAAGAGGYGSSLAYLPMLVPFAAFFGGAGALVLVMPTLLLADLFARRARGRGARGEEAGAGRVVAAAVLVGAGFALLAVLPRSPLAALVAWPAAAAAIVPAALVARLPRRWLLRGIALWGTTAVTGTAALGGVALGTGLLDAHQPPAVSREALVGTWTDGRGGTLEFAADGTLAATRLLDPTGVPEGPGGADGTCTARGTWAYREAPDGTVATDLPGCGAEPWEIEGAERRVALQRWSLDGDPLVRLTRVTAGP